MKLLKIIFVLLYTCFIFNSDFFPQQKFGLVIHGGAGSIVKQNMSPEKEAAYTEKLKEALTQGYSILEKGKTSIEAVKTVINILEDSPLFNAGKGAVLTENGEAELDASIMDGKTLMAGSVTGVKHIKNPINLALLIMQKSPHVMMAGEGAEEFARKNNFEMVDNKYFITEDCWKDYLRIIEDRKKESKVEKHGTVGCIALDKYGNLAAGTSTGGLMMKKSGRIGDSPIIGAGTYANNNTCAVSATGQGEFFIRLGVAKDVSSLMEYKNYTVQQAADEVINQKLTLLGGAGGVIAIDKNGNVAMPFNTNGMYRAVHISGGEPSIKIYKE